MSNSIRNPVDRIDEVVDGSEPPGSPCGRILVVDDELTFLRSLGRILERRGYQVAMAHSGDAAAARLESDTFDIVLADIKMPGLDGVQLLRLIHMRNPTMPVVLMTGAPTVDTAVKAVEYGAVEYLIKPLELPALERALAKAERHRSAEKPPQEPEDPPGLAAFDRALESLWVAYQPVVKAKELSIAGYEALLRSEDPAFPNPGTVLDAAEQLGRLEQLGRRIRELVVIPFAPRLASELLFVNLHAEDLLDPALVSGDEPLAGIANRVVLEITERASLHTVPELRARIGRLRDLGFRIAVDDLGAGYAGLNTFAELEPEIAKLDMSLVRDVDRNSTKQRLVRSMTELCKHLGTTVVAEGVETPGELECLTELGCDLVQGYYLARPGRPFPPLRVP